MRVVEEGDVQAGDNVHRELRGHPKLTVRAVDALLYLPERSEAVLRLAADEPALSPGWRSSFHELLQGSATGLSVGTEPAWRGFRKLRVDRVIHETPTVRSFVFSDPSGAALPIAQPGQYLTVRLPGQDGNLVRSYSISANDQGTYRISVKRDGVASAVLHEKVTAGASIEVTPPRGDFVLDNTDRPIILLSAGIGATPLIAMVQHLSRINSDRKILWIHAARTLDELVFNDELKRLANHLAGLEMHIHFTRERTQNLASSGRITVDNLPPLPADAVAYLCGPSRFIQDMTAALITRGLTDEDIRSELFAGAPGSAPGVVTETTGAPHPIQPQPTDGVTVTFGRSGVSTRTGVRGNTLLETAEQCDVPVRWSCRVGVCHTCTTAVLDGTVSYDPEPLEPAPEGQVLLCCARPDGDLVLDL
jgi:ferredoxin-NADP reductase